MSLETTKKIMEEKQGYKLDHLSYSQIDMYQRCPKQWSYRYIDGLKTPPASAFVLGSAGHKAHEHNFSQKIESHNDLAANDVTEYFAEDWEQRIKQEEVDFGEDKPGELKDTGVKALEAYYPKYSQSIQPIMVERKFEIEFDNVDWKFICISDLVTPQRIIDHKFAKRKPAENDIHKNMQITANLLANKLCINDGVDRSFRFDYHVKTKNPYIHQVETVRTQEDIDNYLVWIGKVAEVIKQSVKSGIFLENTNGYWCQPAFCGFWELCKPYSKRIISV